MYKQFFFVKLGALRPVVGAPGLISLAYLPSGQGISLLIKRLWGRLPVKTLVLFTQLLNGVKSGEAAYPAVISMDTWCKSGEANAQLSISR